jgi:two-component system chemotaxis response regulator CheY
MDRCLIVDDDEMSRLMLETCLSEYAHCDSAENGSEALILIENSLLGAKPYDLLCVDLMMPQMNGLELIRNVRQLEKRYMNGFRSKIFVISASDSVWDKSELILENLCDDYIVKPFNRISLQDKLREHNLLILT